MIRLCYVSDAAFLGGAEGYITRLAGGLDRSRFAPSVLMADHAALDSWEAELTSMEIPVRRVRMRLPFRPGDAVGLVRALRALGPDLVHMNVPGPYDAQMGLVAPLARSVGARVLSTEHLPMVERLWKRALIKRATLPCVSTVVTVSRANVEYLVARQGIAPQKCRVVYNGVRRDFGGADSATARRDLGIPEGPPCVAFVGNILPHKGLARVIRALIAGAASDWHLAVAGDGPDEPRCRELLAQGGQQHRATFLGRRDEGDIERVLSACDVLALPSLMEGLPYVILEAMACARPVVSTRVYGIPEAVFDGETGILVPPGDDDALAEALSRLLVDAGLRRRMGESGRRLFEAQFTLERQVEEMSAVYEETARVTHG